MHGVSHALLSWKYTFRLSSRCSSKLHSAIRPLEARLCGGRMDGSSCAFLLHFFWVFSVLKKTWKTYFDVITLKERIFGQRGELYMPLPDPPFSFMCSIYIRAYVLFQGSVQTRPLSLKVQCVFSNGDFFSPVTVHLPKPGQGGLAGSTAGSEIVPAVSVMAFLVWAPVWDPVLPVLVSLVCWNLERFLSLSCLGFF